VRSWESDKSVPTDPKVLSILSAILGVDERTMFNKAGQEPPIVVETSPTVEEALASLSPEGALAEQMASTPGLFAELASGADEEEARGDQTVLVEEATVDEVIDPVDTDPDLFIDLEPGATEVGPVPAESSPVAAPAEPRMPPPPTEPYIITPAAIPIESPYAEDPAQRQLYRVRTLATIVGLVALVVALLWAATEGLDALGEWWDNFVGTLRL
jgi:hypothetical protein